MREELRKVMAKALECLEDSKYLLEGNRYDAAVNRAYYAMFSAVQGLLLDKGIYAKTHSGAKAKFNELYLKTNLLPVSLGKLLENVSALRQDADYDFGFDVSQEDAIQAVIDADEFLKNINAYFERPNIE